MHNHNPKVGLIILNYNTWQLTIKEIENIHNTLIYDNYKIIIVDNQSTNDSVKQLKQYQLKSKEAFEIIKSNKNRGYAAGNNIGIKRSIECNCKYSCILNNDILFTNPNTLKDVVDYMETHPNVGALSPRIMSLNGKHDKPIYYRRPSFWDLFLGYPAFVHGKMTQDDTLIYPVYAPRGSCMIIVNDILRQIGYLDESTFLYYEEPILGEQLYMIKKEVINYGVHYVIHNHAETIKKNVPNKQILNFMIDSMHIYLSKYRKFSNLQCWLCKKTRKVTYLLRH